MNPTPTQLAGAVPLVHLGSIRARGADAAKFLHSQLSNDFTLLGLSQARLAGFCSAKGRLQASFTVWKLAHDDIVLVCSRSVLAATLKRLSMFVLRAQCKLSDASDELPLWGLVGSSASALAGDIPPWSLQTSDAGLCVRLPDAAGLARALWLHPGEPTRVPPGPTFALDDWRWLEVQSGLPTIEAATVDQFVPQMLNFEIVGGVDFKKGCYPGQEVVARSQYRGTIKRRMFLFDVDGQASAGQEVFHAADPGQPAGMVVNAAPRPQGGGFSALVEVKLAALDGAALTLGSVDGPALRQSTLPYAVPSDAAQAA